MKERIELESEDLGAWPYKLIGILVIAGAALLCMLAFSGPSYGQAPTPDEPPEWNGYNSALPSDYLGHLAGLEFGPGGGYWFRGNTQSSRPGCKKGYFRGPLGDCVKRTCENGGLGKEDCEHEPPPCPEGSTREGDVCVKVVEVCPDGFVEGPDGSCTAPPKECPVGFSEQHGLCIEDPPPTLPATDPIPCVEEGIRAIGRFLVDGGTTYGRWTRDADGSFDVEDPRFERWHWARCKCFDDRGTQIAVRGTQHNRVISLVDILDGCRRNGHRWVKLTPNAAGPLMDWGVTDAPSGVQNLYQKLPGSNDVYRLDTDPETGEQTRTRLYLGTYDTKAFACEP